ncbi:MAG TPA: ATP-binding protein [Pirellulales bacterium]|jgi:signal transduction histidine kinase|nr:ATP-binding protein [Pirellulales bacterium]
MRILPNRFAHSWWHHQLATALETWRRERRSVALPLGFLLGTAVSLLLHAYLSAQCLWPAWGLLATSVLLAALLGVWVLAVVVRALTVERLAAKRTAQLSRANANLGREVAERLQANQALERRTRDLARSNAELEQFAYIASHDLQEPLRITSGYCELLRVRYGDRLDEKGRAFLASALDSAQRMQRLIDGLLEFSRLGWNAVGARPLPLGPVVDEALGNLELSMNDSGAMVHVVPLPVVLGDHSRLTQLFQNLIGNAVKFRGNEPPQVRIAWMRRGNEAVVSVADNGIGMETDHFERIFVVFQRLHTHTEYPGTGIGLAICKKIVELHGGRIWVESEPGRGSTFRFTLPLPADVAVRIQNPACGNDSLNPERGTREAGLATVMTTADCLPTADCQLAPADCQLPTERPVECVR